MSTSLAAFDVFEMKPRHMMSVDPEAELADLGASWNSSIPHVQPDEAIDLVTSATGAIRQHEGDEGDEAMLHRAHGSQWRGCWEWQRRWSLP